MQDLRRIGGRLAEVKVGDFSIAAGDAGEETTGSFGKVADDLRNEAGQGFECVGNCDTFAGHAALQKTNIFDVIGVFKNGHFTSLSDVWWTENGWVKKA